MASLRESGSTVSKIDFITYLKTVCLLFFAVHFFKICYTSRVYPTCIRNYLRNYMGSYE